MKEKSNTIPPSELLPPKGRGLLAKKYDKKKVA